jgi:hypothetical protein
VPHNLWCAWCEQETGNRPAWPCNKHTLRGGRLSRNVSYLLRNATFVIDDEHSFVRTLFNDGKESTALPRWDDESVARARELGYRGRSDIEAVWEMTRDHDLLHQVVAEAAGFTYSPALRYSIDGPPMEGLIPLEERVVFLVQRLVVKLKDAGVSMGGIMEEIGYAPSRP